MHGIAMRLDATAFPGDERNNDFQISRPVWDILDMFCCVPQIVAKFTDPRLFASFIFSLNLKEILSQVQENKESVQGSKSVQKNIFHKGILHELYLSYRRLKDSVPYTCLVLFGSVSV